MRRGIVMFCALVLIFAVLLRAQSGNELLQQATKKVYGDRDFEGAIQIYERILREFAADRALVARALVARGQAEEYLGAFQAQQTYRQVIRDHANQPAAAAARRGLTALDSNRYDGSGVLPAPQAAIYLANLDPGRGIVRGPAVRLTPNWEEVERLPTWSPDGKRIAFRAISGQALTASRGDTARPEWQRSIVVQELETGRRTNYGEVAQNGPSLWFPDSKGILSMQGPAAGSGGDGSLMRFDLERNIRTAIAGGLTARSNTVIPGGSSGINLNFSVLSPDGNALHTLVVAIGGDVVTVTVWSVDTSTGLQKGGFALPSTSLAQTRKNAVTVGGPSRGLGISPDGRTLATARYDDRDGALWTVGIDGNRSTADRPLVKNLGVIHGLAWCGNRIFFARASAETVPPENSVSQRFNGPWQIMQVPVDGSGEPVFTGLEIQNLWSFDLNPDCSRIAFDAVVYRISEPGALPALPQKPE